jgi:hypothetical protein
MNKTSVKYHMQIGEEPTVMHGFPQFRALHSTTLRARNVVDKNSFGPIAITGNHLVLDF